MKRFSYIYLLLGTLLITVGDVQTVGPKKKKQATTKTTVVKGKKKLGKSKKAKSKTIQHKHEGVALTGIDPENLKKALVSDARAIAGAHALSAGLQKEFAAPLQNINAILQNNQEKITAYLHAFHQIEKALSQHEETEMNKIEQIGRTLSQSGHGQARLSTEQLNIVVQANAIREAIAQAKHSLVTTALKLIVQEVPVGVAMINKLKKMTSEESGQQEEQNPIQTFLDEPMRFMYFIPNPASGDSISGVTSAGYEQFKKNPSVTPKTSTESDVSSYYYNPTALESMRTTTSGSARAYHGHHQQPPRPH